MIYTCLHFTDDMAELVHVRSNATTDRLKRFLGAWGDVTSSWPVGDGLKFAHHVTCGSDTYEYETGLWEGGRLLSLSAVPNQEFLMALLLWFKSSVTSGHTLQVIDESGEVMFDFVVSKLAGDVALLARFVPWE